MQICVSVHRTAFRNRSGRRTKAMGTTDFLRKKAATLWTEHYVMAGVPGSIATNSEAILDAARDTFCPAEDPHPESRLHLRLWVDPQGTTQAPWPKPFFRGLDHLIFAGLDTQNSFLIDLQRRRVIGRLSPAMAADQAHWKSVIFPHLLTLVGPVIGVTGLHCACVVRDGGGILLHGRSGSGKSTLALALARRGFGFLSDDWTYFSRCNGGLYAWGLIPRIKLLPQAAEFFPELAGCKTAVSVNGERAFEIQPDSNLGVPRSRFCQPREIIFLERSSAPEFSLSRMPMAEAVAHLEENFLADTTEVIRPQVDIARRLVERGCWQLRYGEPPAVVARKLVSFLHETSILSPI
jgi:hypothetical protein